MKYIYKNAVGKTPYTPIFECEANSAQEADILFQSATGINPEKQNSILMYSPEWPSCSDRVAQGNKNPN